MRNILLAAVCLIPVFSQTMEFKVEFENDEVRVSKWMLTAGEEVGLHRDEYPHVVVASQGGTIRRFEADGTTTDVVFPTGVAVFQGTDPVDVLHRSINASDHPIEAVMVEFKSILSE